MAGWTNIQTITKEASATTIQLDPVSKLGKYAFKISEDFPKYNIGGQIFYMDTTSTGATYKFYKSDGTRLTYDTTDYISQLAEAVTYSIEGTPSKAKFYVYDTTKGLQTKIAWGGNYSAQNCTANAIGSGKTNTANALVTLKDESGSIWYFIEHTMNAESVGGCNDWFIGSQAELDILNSTGLVTWFGTNSIWSSVEDSSSPTDYGMYWAYGGQTWRHQSKAYSKYGCFAMRSF